MRPDDEKRVFDSGVVSFLSASVAGSRVMKTIHETFLTI